EIVDKSGGKVDSLGWDRAVKMLAKPKEDSKPPEGWEEKDGCYFKGEFCLKPDGGGYWRVLQGAEGRCGCDSLKHAANRADELAYCTPPDERTAKHRAAQEAQVEKWIESGGAWTRGTYKIVNMKRGEAPFVIYTNGTFVGNSRTLDEAQAKIEAW